MQNEDENTTPWIPGPPIDRTLEYETQRRDKHDGGLYHIRADAAGGWVAFKGDARDSFSPDSWPAWECRPLPTDTDEPEAPALPEFVAAVAEYLQEGWEIKPPDNPASSLWLAVHPDAPRFLGIVDAPIPSVDCRTASAKLDRYVLEAKANGRHLPDRMLGHYVARLCAKCVVLRVETYESKVAGWSLRLTAPCGGTADLDGWSAEYSEDKPGLLDFQWDTARPSHLRLKMTPATLSHTGTLPAGLTVADAVEGTKAFEDARREALKIAQDGIRAGLEAQAAPGPIDLPHTRAELDARRAGTGPPASPLAAAGEARAKSKARQARAEAAVDIAVLQRATARRLAIDADSVWVAALDAAKLEGKLADAPEVDVS